MPMWQRDSTLANGLEGIGSSLKSTGIQAQTGCGDSDPGTNGERLECGQPTTPDTRANIQKHSRGEQMLREWRRPYRILVSTTRLVPGRKRKTYTELKPMHYGYMGWTEHQAYRESRLPSAGSFLYPGVHEVRLAALAYLSQPHTTQVSIRTNQDKTVYVFIKRLDGTLYGYMPE